MRNGVQAILDPASIAIVGASADPARIGGRPLRILRARGYPGAIFPVNPKYDAIDDLPCYPDIESLPEQVELYVIALPAAAALDAVERAARRGARGVVLFSGGFAEVGREGRALQDRLSAIVAHHGLALLGPNALGAASFVHRAFPTFATALETLPDIEPGTVALVSQSGGFAFNLFTEAYWAGARFSHVISTGNEAGLQFADYLAYLANDAATDAVIGYLEGVGDGARFLEALELLRRADKSLFLIKSGVSERGTATVASHTAQLSGDDSAFGAAFRRYGVTRLATLDEAVDVARALSSHATPSGVAIATNSGGTAVYLADACARYGVSLAPLTASTRERLRQALPSFAGLANPIDVTAQIINDPSLLATTLEILDRDATTTLLHVFLGSMEYRAEDFVNRLLAIRTSLGKPLFVSWAGVGDRTRALAAERGLPLCADPARILRGLGLVRAGMTALRASVGASPVAGDPAFPAASLGALVAHPVAGGRLALDEWHTMALLERLGLRGPHRRLARTADGAVAAAAETGYPCVLKLLQPLLPHRARVGAVVTGIADEAGLRDAFWRLRREHDASLCLVAEQIPAGPELIAGVLADATFGTRAVVGAGGVRVGEGANVRTLVPPYGDGYVASELRRLEPGGALRSGIGDPDRAGVGVAAVLRALAAAITAEQGRITEIECNPVRIMDDGPLILDALAFVTQAGTP